MFFIPHLQVFSLTFFGEWGDKSQVLNGSHENGFLEEKFE